jgi:RNA ligase (TIGR02306 family)
MSEFHVEVTTLTKVEKHPNADTLSMGEVNGYPVIFRTEDFVEGEKVVHVPIDSIVPDSPVFSFLKKDNRRIRALRLRGIFSMGLIVKADPEWKIGQNVQEHFGITKYEPPMALLMSTENEPDPGFFPGYTDIEGLRRWPGVLIPGEEIVLTEKIHGANSRFLYHEGRLWVGSHDCVKRYNPENVWWKYAEAMGLEKLLSKFPGITIFGEVYGFKVQDLAYGLKNQVSLSLFDACDVRTRKYLDYDDFKGLAKDLGLPTVPELYRGPWSEDLKKLAEGNSTVPGAAHVREGFVAKPVKERFDLQGRMVTCFDEVLQKEVEKQQILGRVILKFIGEGYLLRKGA